VESNQPGLQSCHFLPRSEHLLQNNSRGIASITEKTWAIRNYMRKIVQEDARPLLCDIKILKWCSREYCNDCFSSFQGAWRDDKEIEICTVSIEFESGRAPLVRACDSRDFTRSPEPTKCAFREVRFPRIKKKKLYFQSVFFSKIHQNNIFLFF
jgi:hypothetical protein